MEIKDERITIKTPYMWRGTIFYGDVYIVKTCEFDGHLFGFGNLKGPDSNEIEQLVEMSTGTVAVSSEDNVMCKAVPMSWLVCYQNKRDKSGFTTAELVSRCINRNNLTQLWQVSLWSGLLG